MHTPPPAAPAPSRPRHPDPLPHDQYRWTPAKALAFLNDLAQHGNVARAARSVGMTRQSAYRLRDRSLTVAEAWPLALATGTQRAALTPTRAEARRLAAQRRRREAAWFAQGLSSVQGDASAGQGDAAAHHRDIARRQADTGATQGDRRAAQGDRG